MAVVAPLIYSDLFRYCYSGDTCDSTCADPVSSLPSRPTRRPNAVKNVREAKLDQPIVFFENLTGRISWKTVNGKADVSRTRFDFADRKADVHINYEY